MAYRSVDEDFWRSPHLLGLDFQTKALYAYLITQAGATGFIYRKMAEHEALLDLSAEVFAKGLTDLQQRGRIELDEANQLIWVRNQMKWQFRGYEKVGQNRDKGLKSELESLPSSPILLQFLEQYRDILEKMFPLTAEYLRGLPTPRQALGKGLPDPFPISIPDQSIPEKDLNTFPPKNEKTGGEQDSTKTPKPRSPNQNIQDGEIEACRKAFAEKFGSGRLTEAQIGRLAFGAKGNGYGCFEAIPVLTAFLKSLKSEDCRDVEEPFRYLMACAKNPETVERAKKDAYADPWAARGGPVKTIGEVLRG